MGSLVILCSLVLFFVVPQIRSGAQLGSFTKITVQVCPDESSDTRDTFRLVLQERGRSKSKSKSRPKTCSTDWKLWNSERTETWDLGNCTSFYHRGPQGTSDTLDARIQFLHIPDYRYDGVILCSIVAEFGFNETWHVYEWYGIQWWYDNKPGQFVTLRRRSILLLEKITAKVCPDSYSGSNDIIHIELHNGHKSCKTRGNDEKGKNWGSNTTEILTGLAIEECKIHKREYERLNVRASFNKTLLSGELGVGYDAIQLCSIQVDFKEHSRYDGVSYAWNGTQWWNENAGPFVSLNKVSKSLDEIFAPNSYNAEIVAFPVNNWLHSSSKTFDNIAPTLIINGVEDMEDIHMDEVPIIVKWEELKNSHQNGHFNLFEQGQLAGILSSAQQLVLVTHGWRDGNVDDCQSSWVADFTHKILNHQIEITRKKTATIALCWNSQPMPDLPFKKMSLPDLSFIKMGNFEQGKMCELSYLPGARWIYYANAATTGKVGELLGKIIKEIRAKFPNIEYVHAIGHSLGAHVMGNIYNFGDEKIHRISGLDPAGPCFENSVRDIHIAGDIHWGLSEDSADFVDNIHTDGKYYGTFLSKGHVDILTGNPDVSQSGAGLQPTCGTCAFGCCHTLAVKYYLNSIYDSEKQKFYTSYYTETQDENSYAGRSIGHAIDEPDIYAGYNVVPRVKGRLFLPIFGVNGKWYPVCDIANIPEQDHKWCKNHYVFAERIFQAMKYVHGG